MDLLREITDKIDFFKASPDQMDVDEVVSILTIAHEVAQDGLDRSQRAKDYDDAKKKLDTVTAELSETQSTLQTRTEEFNYYKQNYEDLSNVFNDLKNKLSGKLALIKKYSDQLRKVYADDIENADVQKFLKLQTQIEEDFNEEWKEKNDKISTGTFIENIDNFKTGVS